MIKSKKQMLIVIGVFTLVMLLGSVTYAFFNYTRTGSANTIKTGRIAFSAEQGEEVTLSDLFPISVTGNVTPETPGVGSVVVHVTGDTEYSKGIEYIVKAVNVSSNGGSSLPISVNISYSANGTGKTIGAEDNNYYVNRGGNSSLYKVLTTDTIAEGQELVVGYIAPGQEGIDGNITVMAYLDANNIAITDTNPEETYYALNDSMTAEEEAACEGHTVMSTGFTGSETASAFCTGTGTRGGKTFQEHLDEGLFTEGQIEDFLEANVIYELYTDGTTDNWVDGRTVLTTEEWNALSSGGVSFQIKVEANEGIWTIAPGSISSCPGCKFIYTTNVYQYGGDDNINATDVSTLTGVTTDYTTLNKNYFLGFTETQNGKIDRAFACGIKGETPNDGKAFCIEGTNDGSKYESNSSLLYELYGEYNELANYGCRNFGTGMGCFGVVVPDADDDGYVDVYFGDNDCLVERNGKFYCEEQ